MDRTIELFADLTAREFSGQSFNGPSLMRTLRSLSTGQAATKRTYEEYAVWGIVLHLTYWKQFLAGQLQGEDGPAPPVPYKEKDWPSPPQELSERNWSRALDDLEKVHNFYMDALKSFPADRLQDELEAWECSFGQGIAWIATHDTYHVAQIRNMGLEGLNIK